MKPETKDFYEAAVRRAVVRIVGGLDCALDLTALAKEAALSPLHFHRIFRGVVGETPLELHRRLRLERAAHRLLDSDRSVTQIAFEAGYETHESFTRAFGERYGVAPSGFRDSARAERAGCSRPPAIELTSRSALHFHAQMSAGHAAPFSLNQGESAMKVELKELPELRLATVRHVGPYNRISEAFDRLGRAAGTAGLFRPDAEMIAVYHDDPDTTPADRLRSDAALTVSSDAVLPSELVEARIPGGRYACTTYVGPYTGLGDAWAEFMGGWLPKSGHRIGPGSTFEIYRNNPTNTPPEKLRTELYISLA